MSIFFKFGVELGEPHNVTCDGMDMSVGDLKLAIKDQRRIKNVTDFDLQVENGQTKLVYTDDGELIPRGTTVLVRRMPMPRGEKKTWRAEKSSGSGGHSSGGGVDPLSSEVVTSTSEEGRMEQVLAASGVEYGKESWERIYRPRAARPLAGETVKSERRYAHGIPSAMLVTAVDGDNAAKVDRFGSLKLTAVEKEGYSNEKVESHTWLVEEEEGKTVAPPKDEMIVPKDLQCPFCSELLEAAILLPCCVAAACDECARNSLIESDHSCQLCQEKDVSPNDLIPNPLLRKKVLGFRNKAAGREDTVKSTKLPPVPQLLTGNSVLPAEIMLQRQREMEEEKRAEEKRLVEAVLANINTLDSEASPDNLPVSDTPAEGVEAASAREGQDRSSSGQEEESALSGDQVSQSRPSSPHLENQSSSPFEEPSSPAQAKCFSPPFLSPQDPDPVYENMEGESSPPPSRSSSKPPSETYQPSSPQPASTPPHSSAPAPDSTASPAPPDTSNLPTGEEAYSIQSMSAPVPGQTIQTTYNNSYNTYYPSGYYPPSDYSLPPPGYPVYSQYPGTQYDYDYGEDGVPNGKGKTFMYDERSEEDRWRRDRHRDRDRDRDRDRYRDRPGYSNYLRAHGGVDDRRRGRNRSRSPERERDRDRHRERHRSRDRHGDRKERSERSSRTRSKERSKASPRRKESRDSRTPPASPRSGKRSDRSQSTGEKESQEREKAGEAENKSSGEGETSKDAAVDKKEEARQKLKELINKNRGKANEVTKKKEREKKESESDREVDLRAMLQQKKRRGEERDREASELEALRDRERREREKESDGDWHCGDQDCRFINFQKNDFCKKCKKPPPIEPVFWDIPDLPEPKRRRSTDRRRKSSDERRKSSDEKRRRTDRSQDSSSSGKEDYRDFENSLKEDPGLLKGDLLNFSCPDSSLDYSPSSLANVKVSSPADLLSSSRGHSSAGGEDQETRSRHSSRTSGSRPGSRSQVTSFLDDIGDSFEEECAKSKLGRSRTNSPFTVKEEDFKKPLDFDEKVSVNVNTEDAFEKKIKEFSNDSDGEMAPKEGDTLSLEDLSSSNLKLEDVSSQDFSSSQDDSMASHNESKTESQVDLIEKGETETDPKYAWKDRSRTSEEFELSLEINDKDFLETVKSEYRSSSPSWANKKFKFPVKKEKSEKRAEDSVSAVEGERGVERSVSVRKRMQDEIKKEKDDKVEKLDIKEEKLEESKIDETNTHDSMEALKIKGESLRRKERQYRSSKDDLNSSIDKDDGSSKEERKREDRSSSRTLDREEERYERKKREERQKERDRHERLREEEEERRRRRKMEEERRKDEIRKIEEDRRREKKRIEEREREEREKRKVEEEERKRKRAEEESRRKREKLDEEKRRLDEERRDIERKRELDRKREKEKAVLERRERDSRKRSRSRSPGESSLKGKKEKQLAVGDLRTRLEDKKKVSKKQEKKSKSKKKKKKDSSSSSSSDSSSSSSSSGESESEDSDNPAQAILKDKKLLKKILELATSKKKKKTKKKKKSSAPTRDSQDKLSHRRVMLAGRDGLTMQLSQDDDSQSMKRDEVKKRSGRSPVKKRSRGSTGTDEETKKVRGGSVSNSDQETIQINIRNSPAMERMNKNNKSTESSDDEMGKVMSKILEKKRPRSPSPSPSKASDSDDSDIKDQELEEGEIESEEDKTLV